MSDPTQRFSSRVDDYVAYRPLYPRTILDLLRRECGLNPTWTVADIGSGPGNLTRLFLDNGNHVYGVEPNQEMRAAGERLLEACPHFTSIAARAEDTTLPDSSIDLVTAGQAFHWFQQGEARREFTRVLRPSGWVALIWNERRTGATPFLAAYEQLLQTYGTDYAGGQHGVAADGQHIAAFFGPAEHRMATLENNQLFDFDSLRGRLLSSSYVPERGHADYQPMLAELHSIFTAHQNAGIVEFEYDTTVYYGRLKA